MRCIWAITGIRFVRNFGSLYPIFLLIFFNSYVEMFLIFFLLMYISIHYHCHCHTRLPLWLLRSITSCYRAATIPVWRVRSNTQMIVIKFTLPISSSTQAKHQNLESWRVKTAGVGQGTLESFQKHTLTLIFEISYCTKKFFCIWIRYFVLKFRWSLWNYIWDIALIHWTICIPLTHLNP